MPPREKFLTSPVSQLCKLGFSIDDPRFIDFVTIYTMLCKIDITIQEILVKFAYDNKVSPGGLLLEYSKIILLNWKLDPEKDPRLLTAFEILVRQGRRTMTKANLILILNTMPQGRQSEVRPVSVVES